MRLEAQLGLGCLSDSLPPPFPVRTRSLVSQTGCGSLRTVDPEPTRRSGITVPLPTLRDSNPSFAVTQLSIPLSARALPPHGAGFQRGKLLHLRDPVLRVGS